MFLKCVICVQCHTFYKTESKCYSGPSALCFSCQKKHISERSKYLDHRPELRKLNAVFKVKLVQPENRQPPLWSAGYRNLLILRVHPDIIKCIRDLMLLWILCHSLWCRPAALETVSEYSAAVTMSFGLYKYVVYHMHVDARRRKSSSVRTEHCVRPGHHWEGRLSLIYFADNTRYGFGTTGDPVCWTKTQAQLYPLFFWTG